LAKNETEKQKIVKIYNPLDTEEFLSKADLPVLNYQFDQDVPTFISVGTVFPQKGFDRLLKVHKKLLMKVFSTKF
jgi:glycosyltransferase involved in cell wall biosynthesis